ncbi:MAG TPA: acyl-CoA thioesterase [Candidatus Thermoplasmatota archaeon]|jgi:acyl-CoA hydrolase|nr:acyl-CoA thioesterase [Candidatus Thermoplasmatota archaeon]
MPAPRLPAKPPRESQSEIVEQVFPQDANHVGNVLGGRVVHLVDIAGGLAAMRHAGRVVVTARIGELEFREPIRVGEFVVARARVVFAGRTSVDTLVEVFAENPLTRQRRLTTVASVTYVAIDDRMQPVEVPAVAPEGDDERAAFEEARARYEQRKRGGARRNAR